MSSERIKGLEKQIAELKRRWPAHSVPHEMPDPNPALCVGCGMCAQACPLEAIRMMRSTLL